MSSNYSFDSTSRKRELLAKLLEKQGNRARTSIRRRDAATSAPLSYAQRRLWFLDQIQTSKAAYNIPVAIRLKGDLHIEALENTFNEIVRRHEVLRTVFVEENGEAVQVIRPFQRESVPVVDLSIVPAEQREAEAVRRVKAEAAAGFDLARGPLLRASLLRMGATDHVLMFTMHHIISDGWSVGVFLRELKMLYPAYCEGKPSPLADLSIQYGDFTVWQRERMEAGALEQQLTFWKEQLSGAPELIDLPLDRPRPAARTNEGALHTLTLNESLSNALKDLSRREGSSLFMTTLAAFNALLYRYTHQQDIVVGTSIANRNTGELEPLIGFFINLLGLRTKIDPESTYRQILQQVREVALGAYSNQDLPFEKVVDALGVARTLSHTPVFQVAFVLQNASQEELAIPGLDAQPFARSDKTSKFDLTVSMEESKGSLVAHFEYSVEIFAATTIERMAAHFERVLEAVAAQPDIRVNDIPVMSKSELNRVLVEWNDTAADFTFKPVHTLIEEQAARTPNAIAAVHAGQRLTYDQLNRRANRLAEYLQVCGAQPETTVAILMDRSLDLFVSILAVLKSGAAYLPIDNRNPADRVQFILKDSAARFVLTDGNQSISLSGYDVIDISAESGLIATMPDWNLSVPVRPDNLAYTIYTSGSTGRPKGTLLHHGGLSNLIQGLVDHYDLTVEDRLLQFSSIGFDAHVPDVFTTWTSGACLHIASAEAQNSAEEVVALFKDERITAVMLPPAMWIVLPETLLPDLRIAAAGGEACSPEIVGKWGANRRFLNGYGPTEITVAASFFALEGKPGSKGEDVERTVPIGTPLPNTTIYILDHLLQPVPVGVTGELYVGGAGVGRGYLNRADLTAEKFVPNPFSSEPGARLYRTGDLARYRVNGQIEFLGRIDHQVKLRGYRIELQEIERALEAHSQVQTAVVTAPEDANGSRKLAAYAVLKPQAEIWPSVAEYFVYDEALYGAMIADERRNEAYMAAMRANVAGKVVVEVGTGPEALLARMCVEAGARKVYAIELLDRTFELASRRISELGLQDRITLIHGDARKVELPEPADVCVSEIVGAIGGSEGAAVLIEDSRRFLKPGGLMIPDRSVTKIAAVTLPEALAEQPSLSRAARHYAEQIFSSEKKRFDLRVCLKGIGPEIVLTDSGVFEELNFNSPLEPSNTHKVTLTVQKDGIMHGLLVWLTLETGAGETIDILQHEHCWLPVYFPLFEDGIVVSAGDRIKAVITRTPCENGLNPDFHIAGTVARDGSSVQFKYESRHSTTAYRSNPFYDALFSDSAEPVEKLDLAAARAFLKERLPEYMLPSHLVVMDRFPVTSSGKIDRKALPAPKVERAENKDVVEPKNDVEQQLSKIWSELLGVPQISIHDNFFELGGDSILGIQMVARATAVGIRLKARQLFENQTIASLAAAAQDGIGASSSNDDAGPAPITPIQSWFFEQNLPESNFWNQAMLLEVDARLTPALLESAIGHVVEHHRALHSRFRKTDSGWVQEPSTNEIAPLTVHDLAVISQEDRAAALEAAIAEVQSSLDFENGPVIRCVLYQLGNGERARLLVVAHHLVVDNVSWRILLEDLERSCRQLLQHGAVEFPPASISFSGWARRLHEYAGSAEIRAEADFWMRRIPAALPSLPTDFKSAPTSNTRGSTKSIEKILDAEETRKLLKDTTRLYGVTINDVLLAALALTLQNWTGSRRVLVDLEGHGREPLFEDLDFSRTVGWFTTCYPLLLDTARSNSTDSWKLVEGIANQVRAVPNHGIGYGVLKHLGAASTRERLQKRAQAQVSFNYLGQFDHLVDQSSLFAFAPESVGPCQSANGVRRHLLEINAAVIGHTLKIDWTYSANAHTAETIQSLSNSYLENLIWLIAGASSGTPPSSSPGGLTGLSEREMKQLFDTVSATRGNGGL